MPSASKPHRHDPQSQKKPAKRKADAISKDATQPHPTPSGFTISSLPYNLTQSTPKPVAPTAPPTSLPLPSLQSDLTSQLSQTYSLTALSVISSTQITKRVSKILESLGEWPTKEGDKDAIVALTAKGDVAGKLISIVEIVKREISKKEGKWFQYTVVEGRKEEIQRKEKAKGGAGKENGNDVADEEAEESFEVMKTPFERAIEGQPKVREIPIMAVFLSRIRIEVLRKRHGEQTNALPAK